MSKSDTQKKVKTASITEIGRHYVARNIDKLIFSRGSWWVWTGMVWEQTHDMVQRREFWKLGEEFEARDGQKINLSVVKAIEDYVKSRLFISEDQLDSATNLVNLQNGVYNQDDGNLYPHQPGYYMTTCLPFEYDPSAVANMWKMYLMTALVKPRTTEYDPELAEFVQEAVGYSLTTDVSQHVTFWLVGEGANGKGVLFHVLEKLAGNSATALNVGLLNREQYQLANLAGKRLALCSEASATQNLVDDAIIKQIVAADTISVRAIRKEPFDLHPTVKLWWSMNELPAVADTSDGYWRRMRIIPFNRSFQENERIPDLKERLDLELPGIFNWAMEGLRRMKIRGKFSMPSQVKLATDQYREEANPVKLFVDEKCEAKIGAKTRGTVIYKEYKDWCLDGNFRAHSRKNFMKEMERLKFYKKREASGIFLEGIELLPGLNFGSFVP